MKKVISILECISVIGMFIVFTMLLVLQNTISYEKVSISEMTTQSTLFVIMEHNHILGYLFLTFGLVLAIITIISLFLYKKERRLERMAYTKQEIESAISVLNAPAKHIQNIHESENERDIICYSSDLVRAFEVAIEVLEEKNRQLG